MGLMALLAAVKGYGQGRLQAETAKEQQQIEALKLQQEQARLDQTAAYQKGQIGVRQDANDIRQKLGMGWTDDAGTYHPGTVAVQGENAGTRKAGVEGFIDPNSGQWVPGSAQSKQQQIAINAGNGLARNGAFYAANPAVPNPYGSVIGATTGKALPTGVTLNLSAPDQAKVDNLNGRTAQTGGKTVTDFRKAVGVVPPPQQAGFVTAFNAATKQDNPVPGGTVPLPAGVQGPPAMAVPYYTPTSDQAAGIALKTAQTGKANMDTNTLPAFRKGVVANGATTAGAADKRATTYAATAPILAGAAVTRAGAAVTTAGAAVQNAGTNTYRATHPAAGKPGAALLKNGLTQAEDDKLAARYNADQAKLSSRVSSFNKTDNTGRPALDPNTRAEIKREITALQQDMAGIKQTRSQVAPLPVPAPAKNPYVSPTVTDEQLKARAKLYGFKTK